jgi:two-component system, OmpR family, KDP operon response regulator KdpE
MPLIRMETKTQGRILAVGHGKVVRFVLLPCLRSQGYDAMEAPTGAEALTLMRSAQPDFIVVDLDSSGLNGETIVRYIRSATEVPILAISSRDEERFRVAAFDAGADYYLSKPFGNSELLARIRAALRRNRKPVPGCYRCGDLEIDFERRSVSLGERNVTLTPTECALLQLLVRHAGMIVPHRLCVREVWGSGSYEEGSHLLRVNICNLRKKLEADPARPMYIVTEPGFGYRLRPGEVTLAADSAPGVSPWRPLRYRGG